MVPYDVLVDPRSLPSHPVMSEKQSVHDVVHEDSARNSDDEETKVINVHIFVVLI